MSLSANLIFPFPHTYTDFSNVIFRTYFQYQLNGILKEVFLHLEEKCVPIPLILKRTRVETRDNEI